ncbi:heme-dependent oxidative N-demethylase subunit alpha family protein, partial [Rhodosalinus sediminis]|uniref:heme-dependent oxidative N-demethylase subunit alpha family protein n=1 Tax=Rhodosalinus sediminis TaxID=1940533 RepID=UPI00235783B6
MRHEGQGHDPEAAHAARAGTDAPILQRRIPFDTTAPRLPGTAPLDPAAWLLADEAFAAQMALRDRLIGERRDAVIRLDPAARPAAEELLEVTLAHLATRPGYRIDGARVLRPDGVSVPLDRGDPMATLGRLAQEDFCLME